MLSTPTTHTLLHSWRTINPVEVLVNFQPLNPIVEVNDPDKVGLVPDTEEHCFCRNHRQHCKIDPGRILSSNLDIFG